VSRPYADKVRVDHLRRIAYIYVRQSTLQQVRQNQESTLRQYDLQRRALEMGWSKELIQVIDDDQGQSGADAQRAGFQWLVGEVGLGRVGAVFSLGASRLARNNSAWHRLLELCALTHTLIIDEQAVYDPRELNDRMLLGLQGLFGEAELYFLRDRLLKGRDQKAARGELRIMLPTGLVYDDQGQIVLDPDERVREAVAFFFRQFERLQSLMGVIRYFHDHGLRFPTRRGGGDPEGELAWVPLSRQRGQKMLHNPAYAGVYAYGRTRRRREQRLDGSWVRREVHLPPEEWTVLIRDAFPGYISWEQYEINQAILAANAPRREDRGGPGPLRRGAALLVGLVRCGLCGQRMRVRYGGHGFSYACTYARAKFGAPSCQTVPSGPAVDAAVTQALLAALTPAQVRISLAVLEELEQQAALVERQWELQLEQARYEAERTRRQYNLAEPEHRLVVRTLESAWEERLRALARLEQEYEQHQQQTPFHLDAAQQAAIEALSQDLPRVWAAETTTTEERKQIVRLLLKEVTLTREEKQVIVTLHWQTDAVTLLSVPLRRSRTRRKQTSPEVITWVREMAAHHTDAEIAKALNAREYRSARGHSFTAERVADLRRRYAIGKVPKPTGSS
jgi:DNA invertase Pin-like site-specific DNA recombinase